MLLWTSWDFDLPSPTTIASSADENMVRICFPPVTLGNYLPWIFTLLARPEHSFLSLVPHSLRQVPMLAPLPAQQRGPPKKSFFFFAFLSSFLAPKVTPQKLLHSSPVHPLGGAVSLINSTLSECQSHFVSKVLVHESKQSDRPFAML